MPHQGRLVGIDVSKLKVDACICSLQQRLSRASTPQGQQEMIAWLRQNQVGLAVMEARGGYERGWAMALREAGIAVRIVDPKRGALFRPIGRTLGLERPDQSLSSGRPTAGPVGRHDRLVRRDLRHRSAAGA